MISCHCKTMSVLNPASCGVPWDMSDLKLKELVRLIHFDVPTQPWPRPAMLPALSIDHRYLHDDQNAPLHF